MKKKLSFELDKKTYEAIKIGAKIENISKNNYIENAIRFYIVKVLKLLKA